MCYTSQTKPRWEMAAAGNLIYLHSVETTVTTLQLIPILTLNFHRDKQLDGVSFLTSTGLTCCGTGIQNL